MRICLGLALLTDQLFQYLPNLMEFFGPTGVAPQGLHDAYQLRKWSLDPDPLQPRRSRRDLSVLLGWVGVTALFTARPVCTRLMNMLGLARAPCAG